MERAGEISVVQSVAEAVRAVEAGAMPAAGMTMIRLLLAEGRPMTWPIVDISRLTELDHIDPWGTGVRVGALTDLERIRTSPLARDRVPQLVQLLDDVAALGIRHLATLGGNIAWPSGDLAPLLLCLGASLETSAGEYAIDKLPPRTLILAARIPGPPCIAFAEKVGYRAAFSPSLVTVALAAAVEGTRLASVKVAVGGGSTRPQRLTSVERQLAEVDIDRLDTNAIRALVEETALCPTDDDATGAHRRAVAARVIAHRLQEACRGCR